MDRLFENWVSAHSQVVSGTFVTNIFAEGNERSYGEVDFTAVSTGSIPLLASTHVHVYTVCTACSECTCTVYL